MDKKEHSLNVLQSIISRMASNSSNCKLWCITILAGIIVFYLGGDGIETNNLIILFPLIPFCLLDAYYLGLENFYVDQYNILFKAGDAESLHIPNNKI